MSIRITHPDANQLRETGELLSQIGMTRTADVNDLTSALAQMEASTKLIQNLISTRASDEVTMAAEKSSGLIVDWGYPETGQTRI